MSEQLLDKASFGLLRTNPKLTGNVKIVSNETDIYLESFSANTQLSSSKYKAFKISGESTYDKDVHLFFDNGKFPKDLAYDVFQANSDTAVLSNYRDQYEMFYSAGTRSVISESYSEDLGTFAPLYLREQIPNYFVIFRVNGPVAVNGIDKTSQFEDISSAQTSVDFKTKILNNCTAVKTFDLTENSKLGKYIRRYRDQDAFPVAPLNVSWRRDEPFTWSGISYEFGGFTNSGKFMYDDVVTKDTTIMNFEYLISKGYQQTGVLSANILNLEFLFNDPSVEDYEVNRYFGMYVNDVEEGNFKLSGEGFYSSTEKRQTPEITSTTTISKDLNSSLELQNSAGVLLYLDEDSINTITGIPTKERVSEVESIFYIKDKDNQFHAVKRGSQWDVNQIRVSDKKIDISKLSGLSKSDGYTQAELINDPGKSMTSIQITSVLENGVKFTLYDGNTELGQVAGNSIQATIPGTSSGSFFNPFGTVGEIAKAVSSAINECIVEDDRYFTATYSGDTIYIISRFTGSRFNNLRLGVNWDEYTDINIVTYPETSISNQIVNFTGGTDKNKTQIKVNLEDKNTFIPGYYIKTLGGYSQIIGYVPYTLESINNSNGIPYKYNDIDKYVLIQIEKPNPVINNVGQIAIYSEYKPTFGRFSFFPIRDFDYDFYSQEYSELGELKYERDYYTETAVNGIGSNNDITNFYEDGGFANLLGLLRNAEPDQSFDSTISSEYDRLEENYIISQAVASRVIPYINKWSYYNDGKDVRNHPYRLNVSEAFTTNNFAPNKYDYNRTPYGFTHEWYYLSEIPDYFDSDAISNSWSYFNSAPTDSKEPFDNNGVYQRGTFQDVTTDTFTDYFIVDKLIKDSEITLIDRQLRYSTFSGGNDDNFAETFLRGVKVTAKKKANPSQLINFNASGTSYVRDGSFNDYKFSVILVPNTEDKPRQQIKIVKNDKWKTIVIMIFITLNYDCLNGGSQSVDRTMLYSLIDAVDTNSDCTSKTVGDNLVYDNGLMQGALKLDSSGTWNEDSSKLLFLGQTDINGESTRFVRDLTIGTDGLYNNIQFTIGSDVYEISGITKVISDDRFIASKITKNGNSISLPTFTPANTSLRSTTYITLGGGFRKFRDLINSISFANIADSINKGNPNVVYETIREDGTPVLNVSGVFVQTFTLELRAQEDVLKSIYVGSLPDPNKPTIFNLIDIIGYDLSVQSSPRITPIFRHSGKYEPISYDVLKFRDPYLEFNFNETGIDDKEYKEKVFNLTRYSNTQFNSSDIENFGQIRNLFYHKVNVEDPASVLELFNDRAYQSVYPLIDEVGIDSRYYYIFSSNWDPGYFKKNIDKRESIDVIGTRSMTEKKSFFGSKYMETPNEIVLDTFTGNSYQKDAINQPSLISGEFMYKETDVSLELYLFIEKRLEEFLFQPVKDKLINYINPEFGFGDTDSLDDDVRQYIRQNLLKRYKVNNISLYTKSTRSRGATDYTTAELSNIDKINDGLSINDNFSSKILNNNSFDTRVIYNKRVGYSESIGFSVTLVKK